MRTVSSHDRGEKMKQFFERRIGWIAFSLLFAWLLGAWSLKQMGITDFSETVLSAASAKNVDIAHVIAWYYVYLLVVCPAIGVWLYRRAPLREKLRNAGKRWITLKHRVPLLCGALVLFSVCVSLIAHRQSYEELSCLASFYVGLGILGMRSLGLPTSLRLPYVVTWGSAFLAVLLPLTIVLTMIASNHVALIFLLLVLWSLTFWMAMRVERWKQVSIYEDVQGKLHPFLLASGLSALSLIVLYIFRGNGMWLSPLLALVWYLFPISKRWRAWTSRFSFYSLSGYAAILCANVSWRHGEVAVDFFEGANHGIAIHDFFAYGAIPFLQNFDAHMFYVTGPGLLYGWLTGDVETAMFSPLTTCYAMIAQCVIFYLMKQFVSPEIMASLVLFTPLCVYWGNDYSIGMIAALYLLPWKRSQGGLWDAGMAVAFAFLCLFRLDVGASFGLAMESAAVFYLIASKKWKRLCTFFAMQMMMFSILLAVGCLAGQSLGLNANEFLASFHAAISSNQHWSYGTWGKMRSVVGFYFVLPVLIVSLIAAFSSKLRSAWNTPQGLMILFLFLSALFNAQRTLVRHSLVETAPITWWSPFFFIVLFLMFVDEKKRRVWLEGLLVLCLLILPKSVARGGTSHFFPVAAVNLSNACDTAWAPGTANIRPNGVSQAVIDDLRSFFEPRMKEGETYLDFTNQSLFYAFLDRKNLGYVNQTPAMINGRSAQEDYLRRVREADVPYVLMPYQSAQGTPEQRYGCVTGIDGIQNTDRFYLLTEYIGKAYVPHARVGDFVVWKKKDLSTDDIQSKTFPSVSSYDYNAPAYYKHDVGWIPYLWGTYGRSSLQGALMELPKDELTVESTAAGGILMEIAAEEECSIKLHVQTTSSDQAAQYEFFLKPGIHRYYVRLSSDILWFADAYHHVEVELPGKNFVQHAYWIPEE